MRTSKGKQHLLAPGLRDFFRSCAVWRLTKMDRIFPSTGVRVRSLRFAGRRGRGTVRCVCVKPPCVTLVVLLAGFFWILFRLFHNLSLENSNLSLERLENNNKGPGARAGHFPSFFSLFCNAKNPFFQQDPLLFETRPTPSCKKILKKMADGLAGDAQMRCISNKNIH